MIDLLTNTTTSSFLRSLPVRQTGQESRVLYNTEILLLIKLWIPGIRRGMTSNMVLGV